MTIKMPDITATGVLAIAGLSMLAVAVYKIKSSGAKGIASSVASGVSDAVIGTVSGGVGGVGEVLGVPITSVSECEQAMIDGRSWDASFACPLPVYAQYMMGDTQAAIDKLRSSGAMVN